MKKILGKALTAFLIVCLVLTCNVLVSANDNTNESLGKIELKDKKGEPKIKDPKEIDARMNKISEGMKQAYGKNGNPEDVKIYLKDEGLEILDITEEPETASTNSQVTYSAPVVAYDSYTKLYVMAGYWDWKRTSPTGLYYWSYDLPLTVGNVGGLDAGGLWVGTPKNMTFKKFSMTTWSKDLNERFDYTTPWDWNEYGVTIKAQDKCWLENYGATYDYSMDSGQIQAWFSVSGPVSTYVKTIYAHDWNSTTLNNCTINSSGISITFTNGTNGWQGTSQPATWTKQ